MALIFNGFEWDSGNDTKSLHKHGVTCSEAEEAFVGPRFVFPDTKHSTSNEERFILFGESKEKRLLIAFTVRNKKVRVISARPMNQNERQWYEKEKTKQKN